MEACWHWKGARSVDGYGLAALPNRPRGAHRMVYEALVGKVPRGMQLDHLCRNRGCVNPAHLEVVTQRENILRGKSRAANLARLTACPRGHELSWISEKGKSRRICHVCKRATRLRYYYRQKKEAA